MTSSVSSSKSSKPYIKKDYSHQKLGPTGSRGGGAVYSGDAGSSKGWSDQKYSAGGKVYVKGSGEYEGQVRILEDVRDKDAAGQIVSHESVYYPSGTSEREVSSTESVRQEYREQQRQKELASTQQKVQEQERRAESQRAIEERARQQGLKRQAIQRYVEDRPSTQIPSEQIRQDVYRSKDLPKTQQTRTDLTKTPRYDPNIQQYNIKGRLDAKQDKRGPQLYTPYGDPVKEELGQFEKYKYFGQPGKIGDKETTSQIAARKYEERKMDIKLASSKSKKLKLGLAAGAWKITSAAKGVEEQVVFHPIETAAMFTVAGKVPAARNIMAGTYAATKAPDLYKDPFGTTLGTGTEILMYGGLAKGGTKAWRGLRGFKDVPVKVTRTGGSTVTVMKSEPQGILSKHFLKDMFGSKAGTLRGSKRRTTKAETRKQTYNVRTDPNIQQVQGGVLVKGGKQRLYERKLYDVINKQVMQTGRERIAYQKGSKSPAILIEKITTKPQYKREEFVVFKEPKAQRQIWDMDIGKGKTYDLPQGKWKKPSSQVSGGSVLGFKTIQKEVLLAKLPKEKPQSKEPIKKIFRFSETAEKLSKQQPEMISKEPVIKIAQQQPEQLRGGFRPGMRERLMKKIEQRQQQKQQQAEKKIEDQLPVVIKPQYVSPSKEGTSSLNALVEGTQARNQLGSLSRVKTDLSGRPQKLRPPEYETEYLRGFKPVGEESPLSSVSGSARLAITDAFSGAKKVTESTSIKDVYWGRTSISGTISDQKKAQDQLKGILSTQDTSQKIKSISATAQTSFFDVAKDSKKISATAQDQMKDSLNDVIQRQKQITRPVTPSRTIGGIGTPTPAPPRVITPRPPIKTPPFKLPPEKPPKRPPKIPPKLPTPPKPPWISPPPNFDTDPEIKYNMFTPTKKKKKKIKGYTHTLFGLASGKTISKIPKAKSFTGFEIRFPIGR